MKIILLYLGSLLFLGSSAAYIYARLKYRPKQGSDFDEIYWEFEDSHPGFARYNKLLQITFAGAVIGAILLFLALVF